MRSIIPSSVQTGFSGEGGGVSLKKYLVFAPTPHSSTRYTHPHIEIIEVFLVYTHLRWESGLLLEASRSLELLIAVSYLAKYGNKQWDYHSVHHFCLTGYVVGRWTPNCGAIFGERKGKETGGGAYK